MVGSNHGGGYIYSLCPSNESLTEECFQQHVLPFVGENHVIRYLENQSQFVIPAMQVDVGTFPKGSMWRRSRCRCACCAPPFGLEFTT